MGLSRYLMPSLGIAAVIGLGVWLAVEHQGRLSLIEEHRALEQQRDQMADLIASNTRMSNLLSDANASRSLSDDQSRELLRLRGQIGVLRQQASELAAVRQENQQAHATLEIARKNAASGLPKSAATADYWPQDSWAFKGYASPDATLQSSLWAANNGDIKALLASATGEMQKHMEEDFKGKSDAEASIRAMDEVTSMKSVRVVNREIQGDDTAVMTVEMETPTGNQTEKLVMKKIGNEWKLFGPLEGKPE
jgi:hypothetical protein